MSCNGRGDCIETCDCTYNTRIPCDKEHVSVNKVRYVRVCECPYNCALASCPECGTSMQQWSLDLNSGLCTECSYAILIATQKNR